MAHITPGRRTMRAALVTLALPAATAALAPTSFADVVALDLRTGAIRWRTKVERIFQVIDARTNKVLERIDMGRSSPSSAART